MNTLLVIHNQSGSGPFPKVLELGHGLAAAGASVTLLCTSPRRRFRVRAAVDGPVRIVEAPDLLWGRLRQGLDPWNTARRIGWLASRRFDLVHAIDCRPAVILPALWARHRYGSPLVLSWWDLFGRGGVARERSGPLYDATLGRAEQFFEEHFRRYADGATVISEFLRERLLALGFPADRILLQRPGCDTQAHRPIPKSEARAQLGLPVDATILCYVGALAPGDLELLLSALERVKAACPAGTLPLLVGGPPVDAALAGRLGFHVVPRQPLHQVHRYICASDLCLLPLRETPANRARWPSKLGDYLNAGRPIVATRVSDFERLFPAHGFGFLADRATPDGFAAALLGALAARDAWETMGRAGRAFAERFLDIRVLGMELVAFYQRVRRNEEGVRS